MPLYWLCYRHNNTISVVIEPGASIIHARLRAALANLDEGEFTEGHELPGIWKVSEGDGGEYLGVAALCCPAYIRDEGRKHAQRSIASD